MTKKQQLRELERQRDVLNARIRFERNLIDEHKERMAIYIGALEQVNLEINLHYAPMVHKVWKKTLMKPEWRSMKAAWTTAKKQQKKKKK